MSIHLMEEPQNRGFVAFGNPVLYETGNMMGKLKVHIKHNRRKENLQLYLIAKPRTPIERQQNKETLELATKIRAEREQ